MEKKVIKKQDIEIHIYDVTDSTSTRAREYLAAKPVTRALFIANGQSEGRGRQGRSFYSPKDTGLYMTYAFLADGFDCVCLTSKAAVAVLGVLERECKKELTIKWVNDIYLGDKKVCGILCERTADGYIIIGIGINLTTTEFPKGLEAGSVFDSLPDKQELAQSIVNAIDSTDDWYSVYKKKSLVLGRDITYIENGNEYSAKAIDIDKNGGLVVMTKDGKKTLSSGEITVRWKK